MTAAKIGRASQRLVTTLSILSEVVMPAFFFCTQLFISPEMYWYRSLVMMLSLSSSNCFSQSETIVSSSALTSAGSRSRSSTLASRSNSLMLYHRAFSAGTRSAANSRIRANASSTGPEKVCCGRVMIPALAICTARSATSFEPAPLTAEVSITSQPSAAASLWVSIRSPFFLTKSIMFSAMITGMPISVTWVVR